MQSIAEIIQKITNTEYGFNVSRQESMERRVARENARQGKLNLFDDYDCKKCLNKGYILHAVEYDGQWQDVQSECSCMKIRKCVLNLKRSGLENVVKECTFDKFKVTKDFQQSMIDTAKQFLNCTENKWLSMLGASGSGKTMLCTAVAVELLRRGKELKYMLWKDDSRKIKKDNADGSGKLIEYYKSVEVLYIDDLFKTGKVLGEYQMPTLGDINLAFEIINSRMAKKLTTIISSENTIDELFEIDEAIAGRIKQMCGQHLVNISKGKGKNYRKTDNGG